MFCELDWTTPARQVNWIRHWRTVACVVPFAALATVAWHILYPDTFWFLRLWMGLVVGAFVGVVVGSVWQLLDRTRWPQTSGRIIVGGILGTGLFAIIAVTQFAPDLSAQEAELLKLRSVDAKEIAHITLSPSEGGSRSITEQVLIAQFVASLRDAELFYPSHEGSVVELHLEIHRRDGQSWNFDARVPQRHPNDLAVSFRGYFTTGEIIIPGGSRWIVGRSS